MKRNHRRLVMIKKENVRRAIERRHQNDHQPRIEVIERERRVEIKEVNVSRIERRVENVVVRNGRVGRIVSFICVWCIVCCVRWWYVAIVFWLVYLVFVLWVC